MGIDLHHFHPDQSFERCLSASTDLGAIPSRTAARYCRVSDAARTSDVKAAFVFARLVASRSFFQEMPAVEETCPHCGKLNEITGFTEVYTFVCRHCGRGVSLSSSG